MNILLAVVIGIFLYLLLCVVVATLVSLARIRHKKEPFRTHFKKTFSFLAFEIFDITHYF